MSETSDLVQLIQEADLALVQMEQARSALSAPANLPKAAKPRAPRKTKEPKLVPESSLSAEALVQDAVLN
jgi:hypothetical protein